MDTSLPTAFNLAVRAIEGNTPLTPHRQQLNTRYTLSLYGLYQQAMHGDCGEGEVVVTERRPSVGSFPGRALGTAWASRRGMSREEAMMAYIDIVLKIGGRSRFHCSAEEYPFVQQTLFQLGQAMECARLSPQHEEWPSTPAASTSGMTAQSSVWSSEASLTQSDAESSDGEESFQSSRESIDISDADDDDEDAFAVTNVARYVRRLRRDEPDGKHGSRSRSRHRRELLHRRQPSEGIPRYIESSATTYPQTPELSLQAEPHYQAPVSPTPPPYAHDPAITPNLAASIQAIQVSLTALHERISALEHAQRMNLAAQGENPWVALARGMGLFRFGQGNDERSRGWVFRLVMRLMSTARRAIVDVSFVLGMICAVVALRAALRRRLRGKLDDLGGRRAVLEFWKGVVGVVGKIGGGLRR
ncbi:hypothetical protein NliqN6_2280 [Naganishia liquefaciens]|uniref:ACB domain-containing protein n=1 Tax=Naganishia liquefaciens TaxID=104408 RepID=A0A8H3TS33_9TREE|nr:hypothetical protein NliqN6_2280 [Naganishia liquefaciens]